MKKLGSNKLSDLPEVKWVSDSEWNLNFQIQSPGLYCVPHAASCIKLHKFNAIIHLINSVLFS